jgi:hypothetical protein
MVGFDSALFPGVKEQLPSGNGTVEQDHVDHQPAVLAPEFGHEFGLGEAGTDVVAEPGGMAGLLCLLRRTRDRGGELCCTRDAYCAEEERHC